MATHETAALETFLDRLQAASEHVFLHFALAVGVPDHDVVVVRLYIVEIAAAHRKNRLIGHHICIVHQPDSIVLVNDGEIHSRYNIRYDQ